MLVHPQELVRIEARRRLVDTLQTEELGHLVSREKFLVAMRPPQPHDVIQHGFREKPRISIREHTHRAMSFRQPAAVGTEDHRQMRIFGPCDPQCVHNMDLPRRVVEMVIAAYHMGDLHLVVIDDDGEVVSRHTIRAHDDQVIELGIIEDHFTADLIAYTNLATGRRLETHDRSDIGNGHSAAPAATVITGLQALGLALLPHCRELLTRAVAVVGLTGVQQLLSEYLIALQALHLKERPFIRFEAEPTHSGQDLIDGFLSRALRIRVLNPEDEGAFLAPGQEPVE